MLKRGEGFLKVIKKMGQDLRKEKDDFNENHPPQTEILCSSGFGESYTIGLWFRENESIAFRYKSPNGKYDPYEIIRIPTEVVRQIRRT